MKISPLDLVFFRGSDVVSSTIMAVEKMASTTTTGSFSHVALVVSRDVLPIPEIEDGVLYILESTLEILRDRRYPIDVRGKRKTGVQLRKLDDIVTWYKGIVSIARLKAEIPNPQNIILSFWNEYKDSGYNADLTSLLSAAFACLRPVSKTTYRIYTKTGEVIHVADFDGPYVMCSELVSILYQRLGMIPKNLNPSEIMPIDLLGARSLFPVFVHDPVYIL